MKSHRGYTRFHLVINFFSSALNGLRRGIQPTVQCSATRLVERSWIGIAVLLTDY